MISLSLGCARPLALRPTASTELTRGESRHSSSTPEPTMPVAPKRTTFTSQSSRRGGAASRDRARSVVSALGGVRTVTLFRAHELLEDAYGFVDRRAPRVDLHGVEERIVDVTREVALHVAAAHLVHVSRSRGRVRVIPAEARATPLA